VEAVRTGNLLFLSGMLPTDGRQAAFIGSIGAELDMEAGRKAARLAALNALAVARRHLGSLDKVTRVVRLGVSIVTSGDVRDHPRIAVVYGVASLSLGVPVELEVILEVSA
jgi:enamine deaminase RidA (YjgF/YER057c/UK114 family)